jgi:predicted transcriptional regulator of viral defense system
MKGNELPRDDTALGRAGSDILLRLSDEGKLIFSVEDAQRIYGKSPKVTANLLGRLAGKGWLVRLVRDRYLILPLEGVLRRIPTADRYVVAREIVGSTPYYVSHYSAMELHEMTTQPVNTVFVTVPRQRRSRAVARTEYRFVFARSDSFWGWEEMWATPQEQVRVSDLEKTLLDAAARPDLCGGIGEVARGLWFRRDELDEGRLVQHAQRLDHKAASRRVGFLLHTYGLGRPETVSVLRSFGRGGYDPLDPTLPDEGPHDSQWRLRINLDPEELKASVWT